jgi:UDP-GlcNAc3NAcA epimerase
MKQLKILTIVGARPQFIKAAAISRAVKNNFSAQVREFILHTGQHYDSNMSDVFFEEMQIPRPDFRLSIGSSSHGKQTGAMMDEIEQILLGESFDALLVYGDTNSTLAGALAASKLHIPVIHVEAGLRSFNKKMPEEINRICTDHVSTFLFSPTEAGMNNLAAEGFRFRPDKNISADNPLIMNSGDVMYDNTLFFAETAEVKSRILSALHINKSEYILSTIHRDFNTDNEERLVNIINGLNSVADLSGLSIVLPLHPRTTARLKNLKNIKLHPSLLVTEPVSFFDMTMLEKHSRMIYTDSGGVQKEAYFFCKPCIILRPETEWIEILETGNGMLVDDNEEMMLAAFKHFASMSEPYYPKIYGDGNAARNIIDQVVKYL